MDAVERYSDIIADKEDRMLSPINYGVEFAEKNVSVITGADRKRKSGVAQSHGQNAD